MVTWFGRIETPAWVTLYDYNFITKYRSLSKAVYCLELLDIYWYNAWALFSLFNLNTGALLENAFGKESSLCPQSHSDEWTHVRVS